MRLYLATIFILSYLSINVNYIKSDDDPFVNVVINKLINRIRKSGLGACLDTYSSEICNIAAKIAEKPIGSVEELEIKKPAEPEKDNSNIIKSILVTESEFDNAFIFNSFVAPAGDEYKFFSSQIISRGGITSKREAAMFLAQIIFQSGGLRFKNEIACSETGCSDLYPRTIISSNNNHYYGRGYIQLTHDYNYKEASQDLFKDDRLLNDPDLVSTDEEINWATAFWFWRKKVGVLSDVKKKGMFGASTMAINGAKECLGNFKENAKNRFKVYVQVLKAFNIIEEPIESGCYN